MLPGEIVDTIIDSLHNDQSSLCACGLIARSWLPSSRYHIFSRISLHPRNIETFMWMLDDPSPSNLGSVVRNVHITLRPYIPMASYDTSLRTTEFGETLRLAHIAAVALSRLENVRFLELTSFRLADKPLSHHQAVVAMVKALQSLGELSMYAVDFKEVDHVFEVLQSLPPHCSITLNAIEWERTSIVSKTALEQCHLSFKSIQITSFDRMAAYMLASNIHPTVDTFVCDSHVPILPYGAAKFLLVFGHTVRVLRIRPVSYPEYGPLDLHQCHRVQKYCFTDMTLSSRWREVYDAGILGTLCRNSSHKVVEVVLEIVDGVPEGHRYETTPVMLSEHWATAFDWVRLVEILTSSQFKALESLRIKWLTALNGPGELAAAVAYFFRTPPFTSLNDRHLLHIEFVLHM